VWTDEPTSDRVALTIGWFTRTELLAAASAAGIAALPTIDGEAPSLAELESATASLIARGLASAVSSDAGFEVDDSLAEAARTMAKATTLVSVERGHGVSTNRSTVHADTSAAVSVAPCGTGLMRVDIADASFLMTLVERELNLRQPVAGRASKTTIVTSDDIDSARSGSSPAGHAVQALLVHDRRVRVRVLSNNGGVIVGGELVLAAGADGDWLVSEVEGASPLAFACTPVAASDVIARIDGLRNGSVTS
jgi:hypothetical protein